MILVIFVFAVLYITIYFLTKFLYKPRYEIDKKEHDNYNNQIITYKNKNDEWNVVKPFIPFSGWYNTLKIGINRVQPLIISPDSDKELFGHSLILGGSGSGKTTKFVEPLIYFNGMIKDDKLKPSLIIVDPKPNSKSSLFAKYSGYLKKSGYEIKIINFKSDNENINYKKDLEMDSNFFNPLEVIWNFKNNYDKLTREIELFSFILVPVKNETEPHWEDSARMVISGIIMYMIESNKFNKDEFIITNLSDLVSSNLENIANEIKDNIKYERTRIYLDNIFRSFFQKGSQSELNSIISTINNQVSFFKRDLIKILSHKNDFNFQEIEDKPTAIFIKTDFLSEDENKFISIFIL